MKAWFIQRKKTKRLHKFPKRCPKKCSVMHAGKTLASEFYWLVTTWDSFKQDFWQTSHIHTHAPLLNMHGTALCLFPVCVCVRFSALCGAVCMLYLEGAQYYRAKLHMSHLCQHGPVTPLLPPKISAETVCVCLHGFICASVYVRLFTWSQWYPHSEKNNDCVRLGVHACVCVCVRVWGSPRLRLAHI